jgi:type IV pilus assembly protein PilA
LKFWFSVILSPNLKKEISMLFKVRKMVKNKKGFTLVEVIVVAVIVAILAAVAIPLYLGYVKDSRASIASNTAGSIASALAASRNQGVDLSSLVSASKTGNLIIPGVNGTNNTIKIPDGYEVTITDSTVIGIWTADPIPVANRITYSY